MSFDLWRKKLEKKKLEEQRKREEQKKLSQNTQSTYVQKPQVPPATQDILCIRIPIPPVQPGNFQPVMITYECEGCQRIYKQMTGNDKFISQSFTLSPKDVEETIKYLNQWPGIDKYVSHVHKGPDGNEHCTRVKIMQSHTNVLEVRTYSKDYLKSELIPFENKYFGNYPRGNR
jgi:hypothetical protein